METKVFIKNSKGLNLTAIVNRPTSKRKFPIVILLSGFKGFKEDPTYSTLAYELSRENTASVRFDASGLGESEGTLENDYRFSNYVGDVDSVYEFIRQQEFIDIEKLAVMGQSMGAMQAIVFAAKHPSLKVGIFISPPNRMASGDDLAKRLKRWKEQGFLEFHSTKFGKIKVPYEFIKDAGRWDMNKYIKRIICPKLFILGLNDTSVPPSQTREIYKIANNPKELIEIKGMEHLYRGNPKILSFVNNKILNL